MERSTIIASVIAGAGILIAGSVAGAAAINAAASSEPDPSTTQLLAAPALTTTAPATGAATDPLPLFTTEALPPIPDTSTTPTRPGKATKPRANAAPEAGAAEVAPSTRAALPPEQAVALVLNATGGGSTQDIRQVTRAGYEAWAVTVQRPDGSIVTGFVDRASANVFDWRVVQAAPAPVTVAYTDDEEHAGESHEKEGKDSHQEHEGDEDDD